MQHLVRNSIIVIVATIVAIASITPIEKKLRLGKDLAGGVSLVYQVDVKPGESDTLAKVRAVLKDRIDPSGTLDITMTDLGTDRIEITMPLPTAKVKKLAAEYRAELAKLGAGSLSTDEFERIMRLPPGERSAELDRRSGGDAGRAALYAKAVDARTLRDEKKAEVATKAASAAKARKDASDREALLRTQAEQAVEPGATPPDIDADETLILLRLAATTAEAELAPVRTAAAQADIAYEAARDVALRASISGEEVEQALLLSNRKVFLEDAKSKARAELPSPREEALVRIRQEHPESVAALDVVIAKFEAYQKERVTLDDPNDLKRMLRGAGVLEFRITVDPGILPEEARLRQELQANGPRNARSDKARWFKINKINGWFNSVQELEALKTDPSAYFMQRQYVVEKYDGQYYMLCWDTSEMRLTRAEGDWSLAGAGPGQDELGRPSITFQMDAFGASRLGDMTGRNVNNSMAVLLDDEVYTAPNLQSRISNNGQIVGSFSQQEIQYIVKVLASGSLQAKLFPNPISETTLAPELGADNLRQGLYAGVVSFIAISIFMMCYYFFGGTVAVFALLLNAILILGAMALQRAAFSLPGIAGVILTFGQAVDCNVLIYERVREELKRGQDLRTAIRLGHDKAISSIVDGNMTNFIVCVVLYLAGTQEIKGFALTLGLGIVATLFTGVFVTKLVLAICTDKLGLRTMRMLPIVWPGLARALVPSVDWLGLRFFSLVVSGISVVIGMGFVVYQGKQMLDTEFRGGTSVTFQLSPDENDQQRFLERKDIQDRLNAIAADPAHAAIKDIAEADIVVMNPQAGGVRSDQFTIKTTLVDSEAVRDALVSQFAGLIKSKSALRFDGSDKADGAEAPAFAILDRDLGKSIQRAGISINASEFFGGVAFVLDNVVPAVGSEQIAARVSQLRSQPDYAALSNRVCRVETIGDASYVVMVLDREVSGITDPAQWNKEVRDAEWGLIRTALTESSLSASVQTFSPSIARTFTAQAVVAVLVSTLLIMIYVWVRFGSFRYSFAAIVTTAHDCLVAVGAIAFAQVLYAKAPGVAEALLIKPFKIDMNMIASILTVLGYSLNDTIIVLDRVRENRGKMLHASRDVVNTAINETISRTVITSGTTVISCAVLYLFGGEGVRGFAYCLLVGVIVGTYSSIAVASPLVWVRRLDRTVPARTDV